MWGSAQSIRLDGMAKGTGQNIPHDRAELMTSHPLGPWCLPSQWQLDWYVDGMTNRLLHFDTTWHFYMAIPQCSQAQQCHNQALEMGTQDLPKTLWHITVIWAVTGMAPQTMTITT